MKKKRSSFLIFLVCMIVSGGIQFFVSSYQQKPVYQEVTVPDSMFEDKFYFEQLKEDEQLIYKELFQGIDEHRAEITVHCLDGKKAGSILHSVIFDFPEIFWTDGSSDTLTFEDSHVVVQPSYSYSKEEREVMQAEIDTEVHNLLANIPKTDDEYEIIKSIYELLVKDVTYVEDAPDNQNIYSALVRKESVCAGYAKANTYLLQKKGIYSIYVLGTANGESHAWNIVRCNGAMCHVDVTWADPLFSEEVTAASEEILYDYLCCSDAMMANTHQTEEQYAYPACVSNEWAYYVRRNEYYEIVDRQNLLQVMYASIKAKDNSTTFKFADQNLYASARDLLVNELIEKAGEYLCNRYGLRRMECTYREYSALNKFVISWNYE